MKNSNRELKFEQKSSAEDSSRNSSNNLNSKKILRKGIIGAGSQPNIHSMKQLEESKYETENMYKNYSQNKMKKESELAIRPFEPPVLQNEYERNEASNNITSRKLNKPRKLNALQHNNPLLSPFNRTFKGPIDLNNVDKEKLKKHLKSSNTPLPEEIHESLLKNTVSKAKLKPLAGSGSMPRLPNNKGNHYS